MLLYNNLGISKLVIITPSWYAQSDIVVEVIDT